MFFRIHGNCSTCHYVALLCKILILLNSYYFVLFATIGTILEDLKVNESSSLSDNTVYDYIKALKKIFVIDDMPAWNPNLRSKTVLRTSDNRYFIDSLIVYAAEEKFLRRHILFLCGER